MMTEYDYNYDADSSDDFTETATWNINYPERSEKSNREWVNFVIEKLTNNEPVMIVGHVMILPEPVGHVQVITGYKNVRGAEYFKIHDTNSTEASWWRVSLDQSVTVNGFTDRNLIKLEKDNGGQVYYITQRFMNPTDMTVIHLPKI